MVKSLQRSCERAHRLDGSSHGRMLLHPEEEEQPNQKVHKGRRQIRQEMEESDGQVPARSTQPGSRPAVHQRMETYILNQNLNTPAGAPGRHLTCKIVKVQVHQSYKVELYK